jgi:hypothetical protein
VTFERNINTTATFSVDHLHHRNARSSDDEWAAHSHSFCFKFISQDVELEFSFTGICILDNNVDITVKGNCWASTAPLAFESGCPNIV